MRWMVKSVDDRFGGRSIRWMVKSMDDGSLKSIGGDLKLDVEGLKAEIAE